MKFYFLLNIACPPNQNESIRVLNLEDKILKLIRTIKE